MWTVRYSPTPQHQGESLGFVSGAFAPLETMPGWMQAVAPLNPVSHATYALRADVLGTATVGDTATAVLAAVALWAVVSAVPLLGRRRPTVAATD